MKIAQIYESFVHKNLKTVEKNQGLSTNIIHSMYLQALKKYEVLWELNSFAPVGNTSASLISITMFTFCRYGISLIYNLQENTQTDLFQKLICATHPSLTEWQVVLQGE